MHILVTDIVRWLDSHWLCHVERHVITTFPDPAVERVVSSTVRVGCIARNTYGRSRGIYIVVRHNTQNLEAGACQGGVVVGDEWEETRCWECCSHIIVPGCLVRVHDDGVALPDVEIHAWAY